MCLMENHQFWFIKYRWKRVGTTEWSIVNQLIGEHPLHWLHTARTKYGHSELPRPHGTDQEYILDFYAPISAQLFEQYKEVIF